MPVDRQGCCDILRSYGLGANCYVTKPLGLEEFSKIVKAVENFWLTVVRLPPNNGQPV